MTSWLRLLSAIGFWIVLAPGFAAAHPLGNFTINHLTRVETARGGLTLLYTLDIAEIPTFQIIHAAPPEPWTPGQLQRWAGDESSVVASGLRVILDGRPQTLRALDPSARLRPGAGGLPTLYWTGSFALPVAPRVEHRVRIEDRVYADRRIGWKDVVVAPGTDPTHALTQYPSALIGSPRRNDVADFALTRGGVAERVAVSGDEDFAAQSTSPLVRSGYLSDLFARPDQSAWLVLLTVLAAFGLGALHGLEPGHGKALLAFTLVGARATVKQAGILAAALTFAHTFAVLLLGLALFFLADFASESIFAWITLLSGAAVAVIGARALGAAIANNPPRRANRHLHTHGDGDHHAHDRGHGRDHSHDHGHDHTHGFAGCEPLRFSSAVVAAMSGGIAPCPAAIVVLLTALRLHRVGYGIVLIVIFSLGLAAILCALGIAVVRGAAWLQRQGAFAGGMRFAPFVTAAIISIVGSTMVAQGFVQQGIGTVPLVAGLTLAAIAGFACVPRHHHREAQTV